MGDDPFVVLGVDASADAAELRAARRRRAKDLHPDHEGGDAEAMRRLNTALDDALARVGRRGVETSRPDPVDDGVGQRPSPRGRPGRAVQDVASFVVEALPVEAFEAMLVVTSWLGEVVVDDPPYLLEVRLDEPVRCWCRLDLVPDAGATTVSLTVAGDLGTAPPDVDAIRDIWVTSLNQVDWHA